MSIVHGDLDLYRLPLNLLGVLQEEVEEHQGHNEGREQKIEDAREYEAAAQPRDVLRALEAVFYCHAMPSVPRRLGDLGPTEVPYTTACGWGLRERGAPA